MGYRKGLDFDGNRDRFTLRIGLGLGSFKVKLVDRSHNKMTVAVRLSVGSLIDWLVGV